MSNSLMFNHEAAGRFLHLLQVDPATVHYRGIHWNKTLEPKSARGVHCPPGTQPAALEQLQQAGYRLYWLPNGGPTDADVTECWFLFVEWDDLPIDQQLQLLKDLGLPEPTALLNTGGKSLHCYWRLVAPIPTAQWCELIARLIHFCKSDPSCKNPSRLMRLAGSTYIYKTGDTDAAGNDIAGRHGQQARVIHASGLSYDAALFDANLPPLPAPPPPPPPAAPRPTPPPPALGQTRTADEPRSFAELERLVAAYPEIRKDNDQYPEAIQFIFGLCMAVEEAGHSRADAVAMASKYHPGAADTFEQAIDAEISRSKGGSFIKMCLKAGVDVSRHDIARSRQGPTPQPQRAATDDWIPAVAPPRNGRAPQSTSNGADGGGQPPTGQQQEQVDEDAAADRERYARELERLDAADTQGRGILNALPPTLAELFRKRAEAYPVAPEALVPPFLAITSSIFGKRGKVLIKKGHKQPLIAWVGTVAEPGDLKSPVVADMMAPLEKIYGEVRSAFDAEVNRIKAEQELAREEISGLEATIKAQQESGGDTTNEQQKLDVLREQIPVTPTLREYFITKISWEQLGQFCSRPNVSGLVMKLDELETWLRSLDKDPEQRAAYLELWGGGGIKQDFKKAQSAYAPTTAVSIFGLTTPDNIRDRIGAETDRVAKEHREGRTGDGMWPRMLWCRPPHVPPYSNDKECVIFDELLSIYRAIDAMKSEDITILPEAAAYLRVAHDDLVAQGEHNSQPLRQVFLSKLRGYLYRFAGWVSLIDRAWLQHPFGGITLDQAQRAHQLTLYFLGQFDRMAPMLGASEIPEWVLRLKEMAENQGGSLTARQYQRKVGRLKATEARQRFAAMVDTYGMGRVKEGAMGSVSWHVT